MDEGKAENYNDGSDDGGDTDDDNTRGGDSSDSDGGNKTHGRGGRQGSLNPISS